MNVIVFEGALGSGKTVGATIFAEHYRRKNPEMTLYSNFGIKGSKPFTDIHDFADVAKQQSSIVVLDEGHSDLDARSFSSNHVKFMSHISFYLRKLRCTLIITSPLFENLDSRIRGITNLLCVVKKDKKHFKYDIYDVQSMRYLKEYRIEQERAFELDLFDTTAIVEPLQVPAKKEEFHELLSELKQLTHQKNHSPDRAGSGLAGTKALEGVK